MCMYATGDLLDMIQKTPDAVEQAKQKLILQSKHKEELKQTDMKIILQLDQKVLYGLYFFNKLTFNVTLILG